MTAYIKKGTGAKSGAGRAYTPKKTFAKKSWGDSRSTDKPAIRHKATCSKCGQSCEVPFRPVTGKPVFCRDCFVRTEDTATEGRAGDRYSRSAPAPRSSASNDEVLKQLAQINKNIERLIQAVEGSSQAK